MDQDSPIVTGSFAYRTPVVKARPFVTIFFGESLAGVGEEGPCAHQRNRGGGGSGGGKGKGEGKGQGHFQTPLPPSSETVLLLPFRLAF